MTKESGIYKYFSRVPRRRISRVQQWKAPPRWNALRISTSIVLRPSRSVISRLRGSSPRWIKTRSESRLRTFIWTQRDTYTMSEHDHISTSSTSVCTPCLKTLHKIIFVRSLSDFYQLRSYKDNDIIIIFVAVVIIINITVVVEILIKTNRRWWLVEELQWHPNHVEWNTPSRLECHWSWDTAVLDSPVVRPALRQHTTLAIT